MGQLHFKKGTKIGYLAQIPSFEKETTGYDVLNSAFEELKEMQAKMARVRSGARQCLNTETWISCFELYGDLQEEFARRDGYAIDSEIDKVINGLQLTTICRTFFWTIERWRTNEDYARQAIIDEA